jgi:hypothetical protein
VHLGILVDRTLHADKQALAVEGGDMRVQVRISRIFHAALRAVPCGTGLFDFDISGRTHGDASKPGAEGRDPI